MNFSIFDRFRSAKKARVTISAINLKIMGDVHGIAGRSVSESSFDLEVPFSNKIGSDLLVESIKGPTVVINGISISSPFSLIEMSPVLPVQILFKEKIIFKMKIKVPDYNYSGPMTIEFKKDSTDAVNLSVRAIVVASGDRKFELPESEVITTMQKSQIFRRDIQVYKVMQYGETVKSIEVSSPFEIVNSDPKAPFVVDKKDSYIVALYIKAPSENYAGEMEIRFNR